MLYIYQLLLVISVHASTIPGASHTHTHCTRKESLGKPSINLLPEHIPHAWMPAGGREWGINLETSVTSCFTLPYYGSPVNRPLHFLYYHQPGRRHSCMVLLAFYGTLIVATIIEYLVSCSNNFAKGKSSSRTVESLARAVHSEHDVWNYNVLFLRKLRQVRKNSS